VVAGQKPQLGWTFSGSKAVGSGNATSLTAGVTVNVPIVNPGVEHAVQSARKRAEAARLQREEALESRKFRMAEVYEQATSAFDRAKRTAEVVRDSDKLRSFTLQQWQQLGRRSLFDVMSTEGEHYQLRVAYVNALHDGEQAVALLRSLGLGIAVWLE
jgi:outer membrane protein TolC